MDMLQGSLSSCSSKANQYSDLLCPLCRAWPQEKATESLEETKLSFLPALTKATSRGRQSSRTEWLLCWC